MKMDKASPEAIAWQLMDEHQPARALIVWTELIAATEEGDEKDNLESNSCYALIALNRIDEARDIYLRLYEKHRSHRFAHQLCMVEREAGNYKKALEWLDVERKIIDTNDILSLAANTYEYGKLNELLGNYNEAENYAERCMFLSLKQSDLVMLACANRLLGDVKRYSNASSARAYYAQAQKIFTDLGDLVGANEVANLLKKMDVS